MWWTPVIPAFGRPEFEASLGYMVRPYLKMNNNNNKNLKRK
jgi:hypothetical protein